MRNTTAVILICLGVLTTLLLLKLWTANCYFLHNQSSDRCLMTYMFEKPYFFKIGMEVDEKFPNYNLFKYVEGYYQLNKFNSKVYDGIPVIFIPGNAGCYKQVRSLASISMRKSMSNRNEFDYFTIDFNEQLSAFVGSILPKQIAFLNHSIEKVLSLYRYHDSNQNRKPLILIGHSMGGIIAQNVLNFDHRNHELVNLIVTLATPNRRPILYFDKYFDDVYQQPETYDKVVSISGSFQDHLIDYSLVRSNHSITVATTSIPTVWLSTDHLSILWCKQLTMTIVRAFFAIVEIPNQKLFENEQRTRILRNYFVQNNGMNNKQQHWFKKKAYFQNSDNKGVPIFVIVRNNAVLSPDKIEKPLNYLIELDENFDLFIHTVNLKTENWIYDCKHFDFHNQSCKYGSHLSQYSEVSPSFDDRRKNFYYKGSSNERRFVMLTVLPQVTQCKIFIDIFKKSSRTVTIAMPNVFSVSDTITLEPKKIKALYYRLVLKSFRSILQVYDVAIETKSCSNGNHTTASFWVPWDKYSTHALLRNKNDSIMPLKLHSSAAFNDRPPEYRLLVDPSCSQYSIKFHYSIKGTLQQFIRFYVPFLPAYLVAVLLLVVFNHLNYCKSTAIYAAIFNIRPMIILFAYYQIVDAFFTQKHDYNDLSRINEENLNFFLLPLIMTFVAFGVIVVLMLFIWIPIIVFASNIEQLMIRLTSKAIKMDVNHVEYLFIGFDYLPSVLAMLLMSFTITSCGSLSLCLCTLYYVLKIINTCHEYCNAVFLHFLCKIFHKMLPASVSKRHSSFPAAVHLVDISFHVLMTLLYLAVTVLNVPYLLVWLKNSPLNFEEDTSRIWGLCVTFCSVFLWQMDTPKFLVKDTKIQKLLIYFILFLAINCPIVAQLHVYRLSAILTSCIVAITCHQIISSKY